MAGKIKKTKAIDLVKFLGSGQGPHLKDEPLSKDAFHVSEVRCALSLLSPR